MNMMLSELIRGMKIQNSPADVEILGVTQDSRKVKKGFLFVAIEGTQLDGRCFIPDAVKSGAAAAI